jgi:ABC-type amino acid transport substrate-binding protein
MFLRNDWALLGALVIPLLLVNLLPPDTSLQQVRQEGVLAVCVPQDYPPLSTPEKSQRGIDVELVQVIAQQMGLRLKLNPNAAMGRDINPRNWRVTRSQCQVLAGGVVDSEVTRGFLERSPAYLETGWALIYPQTVTSLRGQRVGFYGGISGLDRIALGQFLRAQGAEVVNVASEAAFEAELEAGRFAAGVGESLLLRALGGKNGWKVEWLPEELGRYPLVLGLWKGDLTLKRALVEAIHIAQSSGKLEQILSRYKLAEIAPECTVCSRK